MRGKSPNWLLGGLIPTTYILGGVPNKRYTPEFKKLVVETMLEEKLSSSEAARQFEINDYGIIQRWERIYLEEGSEGLAIERRGRKSTGRPMKLQKEVEEDLIA